MMKRDILVFDTGYREAIVDFCDPLLGPSMVIATIEALMQTFGTAVFNDPWSCGYIRAFKDCCSVN